jgi:glycosyltransferase involved in cell wall biosynthesis
MHVLFDAQIFAAQQHGGISRYIASLAENMSLLPEIKPHIAAPLHINDYLERLPDSMFYGKPRRIVPWAKVCAQGVGLLASGLAMIQLRPDIVHLTYYFPQIRVRKGVRSVITVYDMINERYAQDYSRIDPIVRWKASAVCRADHVICISENTRRDLLEMYDIPEAKVSVIHLGYDPLYQSNPGEQEFLRTKKNAPYILYVGKRSGYKNFRRLLAAFGCSPWLRNNFRLLCFGGGPINAEEMIMIKHCGAAGRVDQVSGADDRLAAAYTGAALFVYPSLYEGFGIPPLEAMSLDCPVACSNTSSIPEVVGEAAATFDPSDVNAIRIAMEAILESSTLRAAMVERGRQRAQMFSWQRCAAETVNTYRKVLSV